MQTRLLDLSFQELATLVEEAGQPAYRARQLYDALYQQKLDSLDQVSTLPQALRSEWQSSGIRIGLPRILQRCRSQDGTVRYLIEFEDGQTVETVWMPEGDGGELGDSSESDTRDWRRATICVSSQVGCAVDCQFCLTAQLNLYRNLSSGEIVGQVLAVLRDQNVKPPQDPVNLVFMGMGEPFLNYDNFIQAVRSLVEGVKIPEGRMTVSTAGIVPRIYDFGAEEVRPKLAISLNASNDSIRGQIMPINRKWNIEALLTAARAFPLRQREKLTFEYVLLNGVNDEVQHARELVERLRGLRAKVNLIALNPGPGLDFSTPSEQRVTAFQNILIAGGVPAFIRKPRGRDIYAACGQLKRTVELTQIA